jgi:CubicO group peptidase (beta-lactamase class C family)
MNNMPRKNNLLFMSLLSIFAGSISPILASPRLITPAAEITNFKAKVDEYIKPFIDAGGFSGAVLIAKGGKIVLSNGYGMANYELDIPNTPQTKFHIASISKTFTATAIMMLEEREKLSTHDSILKFIPDYPSGDKITIHHLLTHTSGIPNVNDFPDYEEKSRFPHTLEEIISWFKDKPLEFKPGEKYSYSNSNYNLLAFIIEKVSGKSYGEFMKENIFEPLGMTNTGHDGMAGALLKNLASGYEPAGGSGIENAPYLDWSIKTGNGSLYSTVEDLYKWDRALYTDKILKKNSLNKMFIDYGNGVGYGWFVGKHLNRRVVYYNGRSPGFTSYLDRFVDDDVCIIILSNNYAPVPHLMVKDIAAILFGESYKVPAEMRPVNLEKEALDLLVGRYRFGKDFYRPEAVVEVKKEANYLVMKWSENYVSPLLSLSPTTFLDRNFWAKIIFEKDASGKAIGLIWRDTSDYQAKKLNE